jgi:hypothetical protein
MGGTNVQNNVSCCTVCAGQDRHAVVMKTQSKGRRLSVSTELLSCDWQPSPFALYFACSTALFMQHVCVCVLFTCVNFCCWSAVAPTCWICTTSFLSYSVGIYLSCDCKMCSAQLELCLLFVLSAMCSVFLLLNFLLHCLSYISHIVAFHCYFSAGVELKWSVCFGPYTVDGSAGDFMWHFIQYINFSHLFFSLTVMTLCSLLVVSKV